MQLSLGTMLAILTSAGAITLSAGDVRAQQQQSAVFHVAPNGNDAGPGSSERPWRTLQHAADKAGPGARISVHSGTYVGDVLFRVSGKPGAPLVVAGPEDDSVIVQGAVEIKPGVSHLRLDHLTVRGFPNWGITLDGSNSHIEMTHLTVIGGEAGVRLTSGDSGQPPADGPISDVTLADSRIRDSLYSAVDCTPGPCDRLVFRHLEITGAGLVGEDSHGADGLAVERGSDILVEDCFVHDNGGDGIDLNSRDLKGHVRGIVVRRNRVVRNHLNGIKLWAGGRIENNAVWGQGGTAMVIGKLPGSYELVNNTVAYNMWAAEYGGRDYALVAAYPSDETGVSPPTELTLRNNIFAFNGGPAHGDPTGLYVGTGVRWVSEGNNLFWSRADDEITWETGSGSREISRTDIDAGPWSGGRGPGARDVAADPRFVSGWPEVDLHLRAGSPAIDAGATGDAPSADLEGKPRAERPDIGAYER